MNHKKHNSIDKKLLKKEELKNPILYVARRLNKKNYSLADTHGERLNPLEKYDKKGIGILREKGSLRADYIGNIWVNKNSRKAYPYKRWTLEVFGKENLEELESFVKKIAKTYNVDIKVILGSKEVLKEEYF